MIYQQDDYGVKDHIREMVTCWMNSINFKVDKMGEYSDGAVVDEGFPTQFSPVIRSKRLEDCLVVAKAWISEDELAITCHKVIRERIPIYTHRYKSEEDHRTDFQIFTSPGVFFL